MSAPARLQILADRYLDLVPLNVRHTAVSPADLPRKQAEGDEIGQQARCARPRRTDHDPVARRPGREHAHREPQAMSEDQGRRGTKELPIGAIGGARKLARRLLRMHVDKSGARIVLVGLAFGVVYLVIALRLVAIGFTGEHAGAHHASDVVASNPRPDILDRNGEVLATDLQAVSVFAEPNKLVDKDEAVELITSVLPDLDAKALREKFSKRKGFVWVKRDITQAQRDEIYHLGLPGVGFLDEKRRIYPNGYAAAHILGAVNTDNIGIAGIEKYIDMHSLDALREAGLPMTAESLEPVQLSLDLHAQHALRDELQKGMERYKAKAAGAAIMDVRTGEVIAMVSLPDFDPNKPAEALDPNNINRMTVGVYEMGSTYKALTTAMALDAGKITLNSTFDTRSNLRYGKFTIHDYHATGRVLTVPEIFLHSSNIGTAKEALTVGVEGHKAFLKKAGQLDRMRTELESAEPLYPEALGRAEHRHHRLRPGDRGRSLASRDGGLRARQRRPSRDPDLPAAERNGGARAVEPAGEARDQRADALHPSAQRREGHGAPGRRAGLFRGRQDRHGAEGHPWALFEHEELHDLHGHRAGRQAQIPVSRGL